jgi:tRNA (uracil-5-)-methyltransferase
MVILQVDPTGVAASELATIKKDILAHFMSLPVPITTVLFQLNSESFNGISETNEIEILHGPGYINEVLLGMNFRISPFAFFQVNTPVAELIYARLKELVMEKDDKECLVLDVCCGTGTIGQLLAEGKI